MSLQVITAMDPPGGEIQGSGVSDPFDLSLIDSLLVLSNGTADVGEQLEVWLQCSIDGRKWFDVPADRRGKTSAISTEPTGAVTNKRNVWTDQTDSNRPFIAIFNHVPYDWGRLRWVADADPAEIKVTLIGK